MVFLQNGQTQKIQRNFVFLRRGFLRVRSENIVRDIKKNIPRSQILSLKMLRIIKSLGFKEFHSSFRPHLNFCRFYYLKCQ